MGDLVSDDFMDRLIRFGGYRGKTGDGRYQVLKGRSVTFGLASDQQANVTIGADLATHESVVLPWRVRDQHVVLIGKTRSGKTSLLEHFIFADLRAEQPSFVLDPHGEMTDRVLALAPSEFADRIINLDVDPSSGESIFGLNIFGCLDPEDDAQVVSAADSVVAAVKKAYGQGGDFLPRLERYLHLSVRTLIPNQLTLPDVPLLLIDSDFRKRCIDSIANSDVKAQLRQGWLHYDQLRPADQINHIEAVVNRLETLLAPTFMQRMLGSSQTTIPFDRIFNEQAVLIITLRPRKNVLTTERADVIGALLLIELKRQLFAREISFTEKPQRVHVYVDEYQRFATSTTAELLTQGAKFGAGLTFAYQNLSQITDETIRGSARGTGTLIALRVSRPDADEIAGEFPVQRRPARTETIEVLDGKEPIMTPTRQPIERLLVTRHNNPAVADAAAVLFPKREGVYYVGVGIDPEDEYIRQLFVDAMDGNLSSDDLKDRILELLYAFSEGCRCDRPFGNYHYGGNLARYTYKAYPTPLQPDREIGEMWRWDSKRVDLAEVKARLRAWLEVHLKYKEDFLDGVTPHKISGVAVRHPLNPDPINHIRMFPPGEPINAADAFLGADNKLLRFALRHARCEEPELSKEMTDPESYRRQSIAIFRERLRCILVVCEGLIREPILEVSGQERDRYRQVVINHPEQNEQDALTEFAGKLVNPDEEWIAHVKLPIGSHKVKLLPPIAGTVNDQQATEIRTRSQQQYQARPRRQPDVVDAQRTGTPQPPAASPTHGPPSPPSQRPTISRRSRKDNR